MKRKNYRDRLEAVIMVDNYFRNLGYRRTAVMTKIISPLLGVEKSKAFALLRDPIKLSEAPPRNTKALFDFALAEGEIRLKPRDLA